MGGSDEDAGASGAVGGTKGGLDGSDGASYGDPEGNGGVLGDEGVGSGSVDSVSEGSRGSDMD
jgi:hypothetical protein